MSAVIPKISQLSSRVMRVLGCNPGHFTLQGTNTYIVGTGKKRALIDCSEHSIPEYITNLKKTVNDNGITLEKIILTHWHPDHVGGTEEVLRNVASKDCKVYKYKYDVQDKVYCNKFDLQYVKDQDEIEVEGATMRLHYTPGHSKDHLCIYLKEEDSLFSGDCILGEGTAVFEDLLVYLQTLQHILTLTPKFLYPGHGPIVDDPAAKIHEYISRRMERDRQIIEVLNQTKGYITPFEIVEKIYKDLPEGLLFGAEYNVRHHLNKLVKEDKVELFEDESDAQSKFKLKPNA